MTTNDPTTVQVVPHQEEEEEGTGASDALPPLESLTCQLCSKYFTEPVTLPCLHSYCKSCLEEFNGRSFAQEMEPESDEDQDGVEKPKRKSKPVHCPCCKDNLHLENFSHYAEPFPNERLARIVTLLRDTHILCQNCEKGASEVRCNVCDAYTCLACFDKTHNAPIFSKHKADPLTHPEMTANPKCDSHVLDIVEFFCGQDEIGVCNSCLLRGDFKGKDYSLIADVRAERQGEIEDGVNQVLMERESLIEGRKNVETTIDELDQQLLIQKQAVKDNFQAIRNALDEREAETISELQHLHDSKHDVLTRQIHAIDKEKRRLEDGISNIELVTKHSNDLEVVYLTYVLQGHLAALRDVPSTSPLPGSGAQPNHEPAVDSELPVILSSKIPELVSAYASVGDASLVEEIASGQQDPSVLSRPSGTKEQQAILKGVAGKDVDGADAGCILQ